MLNFWNVKNLGHKPNVKSVEKLQGLNFYIVSNFSAGIFKAKSMKQLEHLFDRVYIIPKKEWMSKYNFQIDDLRKF